MGCSRQKEAVGAWEWDACCGVSSARCCASAARPERLHSGCLTRTSSSGLIEDVPAASERTSAGLRAMNNPSTLRRSPLGMFPGQPRPRLYDRVVEVLRTRHYSRRTEQAYIHWIRRFILFHARAHLREVAEGDVNRFLTHLAVKENVAASTLQQTTLDRFPVRLPRVAAPEARCRAVSPQNQTLAALLFLYKHVLEQPLDRIEGVVRARKPKRLPAVLTQPLQDHLRRVREQHEADLKGELGRAPLPDALVRKYPNADREWGWQWVFPASSHYVDPGTGIQHRHHLHESVVQKEVRRAAHRAGLAKRVTTHTFRHSFATHLLEDGYDIRTVQELLEHKDVETTITYTYVLNRGGRGVHSPLDRLPKPIPTEGGGITRTDRPT